ncbi:MAG: tail fiber domain-containing protein [Bacteroidota bacterium]
MEKQRSELKFMFRDGARPNGNDFSDMLESFIHRSDDGLTLSARGALVNNFTLGNFNATPVAGSMKFLAGEIYFFDGTNWKNVSSNDLGFRRLSPAPSTAAAPDAAYFGKVGINLGTAPPATLDYDLEIGPRNAAARMRSGTAFIGNGSTSGRAYFSHSSLSSNINANYGLAQDTNGAVFINVPSNSQGVTFGTGDQGQLLIKNGRIVVGNTIALTPNPNPPATNPTDQIMLHCHGHAIKSSGGAAWLVTSDIRTKKDVAKFADGLDKVRALNAIRFRYNGKGGTKDGQEQIGLSGQDVEKIMPYMVTRLGNKTADEGAENYPDDMIVLDSSPLIYVLLNAVQELDKKLTSIETA